jgi:hypothetical protein
MNQYFTDFYTNWTGKANRIVGDNLSNVYDKYMTLFVIYNNLYNQIPDKLISNGIAVPNKIFDNKAATQMVVQFLGANAVLSELVADNLMADVDSIISLIEQETFHIKINHGQYDRNEDLKILWELRSTNEQKKTIAILKVVYHVRWNIFHGNKDFQEYQRLIVEPLTRILLTTHNYESYSNNIYFLCMGK